MLRIPGSNQNLRIYTYRHIHVVFSIHLPSAGGHPIFCKLKQSWQGAELFNKPPLLSTHCMTREARDHTALDIHDVLRRALQVHILRNKYICMQKHMYMYINIYLYIHIFTYIYTSIYICICFGIRNLQ